MIQIFLMQFYYCSGKSSMSVQEYKNECGVIVKSRIKRRAITMCHQQGVLKYRRLAKQKRTTPRTLTTQSQLYR